MLHYFAKDFFAPLILTGHLTASRDLKIFLVSDSLEDKINATVAVEVFSWNAPEPLKIEKYNVDRLIAGASLLIADFWLDKYLQDANCGDLSVNRNQCFIRLSSSDADGQTLTPDNFVFPEALHKSDVPKSTLNHSVVQLDEIGREFQITTECDATSLFVWLESGEIKGRFSENGFHQVGKLKEIKFTADYPVTLQALEESLTLTHLMDGAYGISHNIIQSLEKNEVMVNMVK